MGAAGVPRAEVVFGLAETGEAGDARAPGALADHRRSGGFRVAPDGVGSGHPSPNPIHRPRPGFFTELDPEPTRGVEREPYRAAIARKIVELARDPDISTIAEGAENGRGMDQARAHGAAFARGR